MFDKQYEFKGKHAVMVNKLTSEVGKNKIFKRNLDVYLLAPIIGYMYDTKRPLDKDGNTTSIFAETIIAHQDKLFYNYRLIILQDSKHCADLNMRIDRAFRTYGKEETKDDMELFEQYVRGGVEIIYEKILGSGLTMDDWLKNLYDFMKEISIRNSDVSSEAIEELCRKASS